MFLNDEYQLLNVKPEKPFLCQIVFETLHPQAERCCYAALVGPEQWTKLFSLDFLTLLYFSLNWNFVQVQLDLRCAARSSPYTRVFALFFTWDSSV